MVWCVVGNVISPDAASSNAEEKSDDRCDDS